MNNNDVFFLTIETGINTVNSTYKRRYKLRINERTPDGMVVSMWATTITPSGMATSTDEATLMENKLVTINMAEIRQVLARTALRLDPLLKRNEKSIRVIVEKLENIKNEKVKAEEL